MLEGLFHQRTRKNVQALAGKTVSKVSANILDSVDSSIRS